MYGSSKYPAKSDFRYDDDQDASDNGLENWITAWTMASKTWFWISVIALVVIIILAVIGLNLPKY
jgi:hypothetical protein